MQQTAISLGGPPGRRTHGWGPAHEVVSLMEKVSETVMFKESELKRRRKHNGTRNLSRLKILGATTARV